MSEMFRNYPQPDDYKPDNYPKCKKPFQLDIMTGETAIHSFEIPFNIEENCIEYEVIYKLGIKPIIIKNSWVLELTYNEKTGHSIITCVLAPEETKRFENTNLSARVQVKFYMNNNSVQFSEIYRIKVTDSLEVHRTGPDPSGDTNIVYGTGYGWTED